MKNISFYFTRHAYSCANLLKKKSIFKLHKIIKDPHISDIGVISSLKLSKKIKKIKYNHIFVSPLIRTWETLLCMYSSFPNNIYVAPYISESNKLSVPIITLDNSPYKYSTQLNRLKLFKHYMSLKYKIKFSNKIKPKYNGLYSSKYTSGGNIIKFIQWYINTFKINTLKIKNNNVLIMSHGDVLRQFIKKIYKNLYNKNAIPLTIKHNNNFIFKLTLSYDATLTNLLNNNDIFTLYQQKKIKLSCKIINHGVKIPNLNKIKHIKVPFMKTKKITTDITMCDLY